MPKRTKMLSRAFDQNEDQFFSRYTFNQRLIDIEAEIKATEDQELINKLRAERIQLLTSLKAEKIGVSTRK